MQRFACAVVFGVCTIVSIPGCGGGGQAEVQNSADDQEFYRQQIAKDEAMDKANGE